MSLFRERSHRLTRPLFVFLVAILVLNVFLPTLIYARESHIAVVGGTGSGTYDGHPDEWESVQPGMGPMITPLPPVSRLSLGFLLREVLLPLLQEWI